MATGCSAPISSTTVATRRWGAPGATWTSPRSGVRRSGRTRPRAIPRPRRLGGGTGTTNTPAPSRLPGDAPGTTGGVPRVTVIRGGRVVDPESGRDEVTDVVVADDCVVSVGTAGEQAGASSSTPPGWSSDR